MSFRPDSPLNRLILLWPGVPIGACALGFGLALVEVGQTREGSFAALAIAMGFGLALSLGLLFHCFFIAWLEVIVSGEGVAVRPVGMGWFNAQPRLFDWAQVEAPREVITREGGHLELAAAGRVYKIDRALFRQDTYLDLCRMLAQRSAAWNQFGYGQGGLTAAA